MGARRRGGSRTGTFLVLAGIVGVLSATFLVGVWTGHNWPVLFGRANKIPATEPAGARRGVAERPKAAETLPALTFYDELKAPLTAPPPPPPRGAKPPRPAEPPRREPAPEPLAGGDATTTRVELTPPRAETSAVRSEAPTAHPEPAPADGGARFTVQVAAYNARPPADALRAMLAAAGHDARVVEAATPSGMKYRVQVGAFTTRPAAQDAAARLSTERSLAAFVTTR
jgi:cell division protein FtsN